MGANSFIVEEICSEKIPFKSHNCANFTSPKLTLVILNQVDEYHIRVGSLTP